MKIKHIISIIPILLSLAKTGYLNAQTYTELWGVTSGGGCSGWGCIFKTDANGNNEQVAYSFGSYLGKMPVYTHLCQAPNNKLYGMTSSGGANDYGVLFEYDPATNTYIKKMDFSYSNGRNPQGSLMLGSNGKLYGMTIGGGNNGYGVLFEYDAATNVYTRKVNFAYGSGGFSPQGSLIEASNGKLYGMTSLGGNSNLGVIFEYDPATNVYTKKLDFDGESKGASPYGSLMQASNGKLYGMTHGGGANNAGVIFEYDLATDSCTKLLDFDGASNGYGPYGSLIQAANGKLYGLTFAGGSQYDGVLFEYDVTTNTYLKKMDFDETKGEQPHGSLMQANNGKLYGMTYCGGSFNGGVLFEFDLYTDTYTKKLDFTGLKGSCPHGSLIQISNGKIYGMTASGGSNDFGVLFEYDTTTDTTIKILDFETNEVGRSPMNFLTQSDNGKLYGMTQYGGIYDMGVLFEYDPIAHSYMKKFNLGDASKGSYPKGSLLQSSNGKLYGMTSEGGYSDAGILFEYNPSTNTFAKKLDFDGLDMGGTPYGSLMQASNGKLYGMTSAGGSFGYGVLFEYDPALNNFAKKRDFNGSSDGSCPIGSLIQASNGKLYGMTSAGGSNNAGVIFEYNPSINTFTTKFNFNGTYGTNPCGSLIETSNSKMYGLTRSGGSSNAGVLFEYDATTDTYTKRMDFVDISTGSLPYGSLMKASNGKLYGVTCLGGSNYAGVLFEYDPSNNAFTKKLDFNEANGSNPFYSQLIEICMPPVIAPMPANENVCAETDVTLGINATGNYLSYQWQKNEGIGFVDIADNILYQGCTDDTLHIFGIPDSMNGWQFQCVITSNCPTISICSNATTLTVNNCDNIMEITHSGVSVFPNPSNGELEINLNAMGNYFITVSNTLGEQVLIKEISGSKHSMLDLTYLKTGVYFLKIESKDGFVVKKIVIKR